MNFIVNVRKSMLENEFSRKYNDTIMIQFDVELHYFHQFNTSPFKVFFKNLKVKTD